MSILRRKITRNLRASRHISTVVLLTLMFVHPAQSSEEFFSETAAVGHKVMTSLPVWQAEEALERVKSRQRCPNTLGDHVIKLGNTLCFNGTVTKDKLEQVQRLSNGVTFFLVNSSGGNLKAALDLKQIIETQQWVTYLNARDICWSACVHMLAAGKPAIIESMARVGVHFVTLKRSNRTVTDPGPTMASLGMINTELAKNFRENVVSRLRPGISFEDNHYPKLYDWELNDKDLLTYGIGDIIIDATPDWR